MLQIQADVPVTWAQDEGLGEYRQLSISERMGPSAQLPGVVSLLKIAVKGVGQGVPLQKPDQEIGAAGNGKHGNAERWPHEFHDAEASEGIVAHRCGLPKLITEQL